MFDGVTAADELVNSTDRSVSGVPLQASRPAEPLLPELSAKIAGVIGAIEPTVTVVFAVFVPLFALFVLGPWVGNRVVAVTRRIDLGEAIMETPLGGAFVSSSEVHELLSGIVTALFVLIGLVVSLSLLEFNRMVEWAIAGARYVPSLFGGVVILLVGFVVAGYVSRSIKDTEVVGETDFAPPLALAGRAVVYFTAVSLALDAFGYSTAILNTMVQAVAIGLGLGVAIALGIGFGLGSQEYVAERIGGWVEDG